MSNARDTKKEIEVKAIKYYKEVGTFFFDDYADDARSEIVQAFEAGHEQGVQDALKDLELYLTDSQVTNFKEKYGL